MLRFLYCIAHTMTLRPFKKEEFQKHHTHSSLTVCLRGAQVFACSFGVGAVPSLLCLLILPSSAQIPINLQEAFPDFLIPKSEFSLSCVHSTLSQSQFLPISTSFIFSRLNFMRSYFCTGSKFCCYKSIPVL